MGIHIYNIVYPTDAQPATSAILSVDNGPAITITVQPNNGGILLPTAVSLAPGAVTTQNDIVFSVRVQPPAVIYGVGLNIDGTTPDPKPTGQSENGASTTSAVATSITTTAATTSASTAVAGTPSNTSPTVSASTTSSPPRATSQNVGLAAGPVAGIAIGALIAGALIAGLVLWFCWRRKRTPKPQYSHANTYAMASQEKGFSAKTVPLAGAKHSTAGVGGGLPQPLEDKAISGDVSKISNAIKNHVQSYYHTSRISPGLIDYDDLHALGSNLPISVGTLTTLMGNAATREIALRFIIAWVVVSRLQPSKDSSKSFLPSEVALCYRVISTGDRGFQAQASLMARWRVMTAELTQSNYVRNPFTSSDSRNASIQAAFTVLDSVLQPYADSRMNNEERKRNLEELLKRSASFAFTLFSQPSAWEFEWQEEQAVTSGELCIFPALVQVADETGQTVNPPRPFSEAVVRRLDT